MNMHNHTTASEEQATSDYAAVLEGAGITVGLVGPLLLAILLPAAGIAVKWSLAATVLGVALVVIAALDPWRALR